MKGIKKGLKVQLISGDEKGSKGEILKVLKQSKSVVVKGLNISKKTIKGNEQSGPGKIEEKEMPLNWSKIKII